MKIQSINSFYNPFYKVSNIKNAPKVMNTSGDIYDTGLGRDIVSFSSKEYSIDMITNPTGHCAYCGCKLYNDTQIESIAKEIMLAKASRLEGKVKSVLEKLEEAKHSQELTIAKRIENKDEIDFFNKFLDAASKKSYLKGEEIFKQVYNIEYEEGMGILTQNMQPLKRTIDHVSPQREEKENDNSDINLVESCFCCNSRLKNGISFNEFYAMFPTISNNMPREKLDFAKSQILETSQSQIIKRISALNMIKLLDTLFAQRLETQNALDSTDFRIKECLSGIDNSIKTCETEIADKQSEKEQLEQKFSELSEDPEYVAMLDRLKLNSSIDSINKQLEALRNRRSNISENINLIKNPPKSKKKNIEKMSEEEKTNKINQLKSDLAVVNEQIKEQEDIKAETELQLEELNTNHPTIEMLQGRKSKIDLICNAYCSLDNERMLLAQRREKEQILTKEENDLKAQINAMPASSSEFKIEKYALEEQEQFSRYKELLEALSYIDEHPNGSNVTAFIRKMAKEPILSSIEEMKKIQVIIDYNDFEHRNELQEQLQRIRKTKTETQNMINQSEKNIRNFETITSKMPLNEAEERSAELAETIRNLTETQNYIKIPQIISSVNAEITLLKRTVEDLQYKRREIEKNYSVK